MQGKDDFIGHVTKGDVLIDLGFSAEESASIRARGDVLAQLQDHVRAKKMTQAKLAKLLHVHQPDVSNLMRGRVDRFSLDRLIGFATRLGLRVNLTLEMPKRPNPKRVVRRAA